ncbi:YhjD/YihY/BrkB family envelope integrity protein [Dechloromonas sp. HYN0024]|uniref:YhjD/YihY/BrkB family envelope integrity protein n=1 Tax=Dechloromonas sp. HYN0024 TaxID=2231055 RepID=UPI000E4382E1|nr:YhjD/YihY/BrkB family envelope integrity protein [Dechloromonas sp. HYN0024]AXS79392.1 YihY family inner membrane protein [Dechloromonas sp. HYN0024]
MPNPSRTRRGHAPQPRTVGIFRRFLSENMMQTSAALAFTTLMALVPLVAVVLSVAGAVPYLDLLVARLDLLIREALLPPGAAGAIAGNIGKFSHKAQNLTLAGIAVLSVTAFLLMHTIERAFNHLWHVEPRPLLDRLRLYAFVMAVWPFVLGAVAGAMSFAVTTSLGWFDEPIWFRRFALKAVAVLILGLFFSFLYYAVPNAQVTRRAALAGGVFATLAFSLMQKFFESFLVSSAMLKSIYGAFAAFPVFLVWLHLSWAVVLFGGLIAASIKRPAKR